MSGPFRSGFVGIVGRPNVGKSTMLNTFLGEKIAIVSPKPQTTRHRILGVLTREDAQVMFLDTPGWHQPEHALGRYMAEVIKAVIEEADVLVAVIDARVGLREDDERVLDRIRQAKRPAVLALNKVDAVKKPKLLPLLEACAKTRLFSDCVPVSALTGDQMPLLLSRIIARLPEGPRWYEPDQRTDQTDRQRITELIREQILLATRQEVPHAVAVRLDELKEEGHLVSIQATILIERPGQKAILIGRGGAMLKRIGQSARSQIEQLLGRKVYLGLWVKVVEDWRRDARILRELGYAEQP
ncbi:MAG: GTPase Era [Candidatus Omnitrophica bacterium]|nr:GTPase Era [Candidatus Omnitrophota bacterium]